MYVYNNELNVAADFIWKLVVRVEIRGGRMLVGASASCRSIAAHSSLRGPPLAAVVLLLC